MIKHIVMWTLHNKEDAQEVKTTLEALRGKIPGLLEIEVGIDVNQSPTAADVVLYSVLKNKEALQCYQTHPLHQSVLPLMTRVASSRMVVDYEA